MLKTLKSLSVLILYSLLIGTGTSFLAGYVKGEPGIRAAIIATICCAAASALAIISINFLRYVLKSDFTSIIMGIIFRTGIPLLGVIIAVSLAEKDFEELLLCLFTVVYLLMLPVSVFLSLPESGKAAKNTSP